jgi:hypothetical protein
MQRPKRPNHGHSVVSTVDVEEEEHVGGLSAGWAALGYE